MGIPARCSHLPEGNHQALDLFLWTFLPPKTSEHNGTISRQWQPTLTRQLQGTQHRAHDLMCLCSPPLCLLRRYTVTAQIVRSLSCFPPIVTFSLCRNEDGLKTKRISFFTTRGRQRSGTETGVWGLGGAAGPAVSLLHRRQESPFSRAFPQNPLGVPERPMFD